jgi:hypothetical protein
LKGNPFAQVKSGLFEMKRLDSSFTAQMEAIEN